MHIQSPSEYRTTPDVQLVDLCPEFKWSGFQMVKNKMADFII
jgi:hypothetical protein